MGTLVKSFLNRSCILGDLLNLLNLDRNKIVRLVELSFVRLLGYLDFLNISIWERTVAQSSKVKAQSNDNQCEVWGQTLIID